jgi:NADPH-dependent 2,4-dienoyl-CoA reductase/sulfur reductase-like enzyme
VAGENAIGGDRRFAGVLGTQVVKVFDLAIASTGLRDSMVPDELYHARTEQLTVPDHKRYYPGAVDLTVRVCGGERSGRLLGAQIAGALSGQVARRIDVRHRAAPRDDHRRTERPGPQIHATLRHAMGRDTERRAELADEHAGDSPRR